MGPGEITTQAGKFEEVLGETFSRLPASGLSQPADCVDFLRRQRELRRPFRSDPVDHGEPEFAPTDNAGDCDEM